MMGFQLFDPSSDLFFPGSVALRHACAPSRQFASRCSKARSILLDVVESADAYHLAADLPGVAKEEIKLNIVGDVLSLSVEKSGEQKEHGNKVHRVERSSNYMKRSVRLPESADLSKITARYQDGVLRLDIAKVEAQVEQSRAISIE